MNLSHRFQTWFLRRGALALLIVVVVLLWIAQLWLEEPEPRITRTLASSTQHVEVLWIKQDISSQITASDGVVYAIPLTWDSLVAFDIKTGSTIWEIIRSGARGLLANKNTVFVATSVMVDAYETKTGEIKWSTELGDGHVSIIPQLDAGMLRIYYGDKLFELDPETGKILTTVPKDSVVWVSGNVVLKIVPNNKLTALDKQTGETLWTNCDICEIFYVEEGREPQDTSIDILIVGYKDKRICALNLLTGEHNWCRPEAYISRVAVDHQSQLGYAMRGDFVLVTIDLQTGNILGETSFLSSEPDKEYFGSVSIIFSDEVLLVSFNDSRQTFGLSLSQ